MTPVRGSGPSGVSHWSSREKNGRSPHKIAFGYLSKSEARFIDFVCLTHTG